jgi:histidinol-phosphate/aromatic aminotransferase/cobyric acid decarboxylase-like protein
MASLQQPASSHHSLSVRGQRAVTPALPYFDMFFQGMREIWQAESRTDGYILLCVAENRLAFPQMALSRLGCTDVRGAIEAETSGYCDMRGRDTFRAAFAATISRTLLGSGCVGIDPGQLVVGSGCGALINHLAFLLCERGDGVLIPVASLASASSTTHSFPDLIHLDPDVWSTIQRFLCSCRDGGS